LLFFLSPHCPICKKLLPILQSTAQRERDWLEVVLASDGPQPEHLTFYHDRHLEGFTYVLSERLGRAFEVARLPYAVLIDGRGIVRAKGLVNSREHLESLFTASELGVGSAQEWLERQDAEAGVAERTGAGRV
jgi:methylamine dehydrogenase accessory protein MauD